MHNDFSIKRTIELSTSKVTQTSIPPRENVSYSKETQTQIEQYEREGKLTYTEALTFAIGL